MHSFLTLLNWEAQADLNCRKCHGRGYVLFGCGTPWRCSCVPTPAPAGKGE